jgi:hypothetical protein
VQARAEPFPVGSSNNGGGGRERRSDEVVCADAFRKALAELQQRARTQGASAVVGIVSNYNKVTMDSPQVYECHIGITRGVVELKAVLSRAVQPVMAPPIARTAPAPRSAMAPRAIPEPVEAPIMQPARIATGYAAIDDIDAVPYLSERGRNGYREYLTRPTPKAFAIAPNGAWFSAWSLVPGDATMPTDPTERAMVICERSAKVACKLYAVNGSVVWSK